MALNPRIDIDVRTAVSLIPGVGEAVGFMIGTAQYGRINEIITTSNFTTVLQEYKEDKDDNTTIIKAAELFFANGGSILKILRIANDDVEFASKQFAGNSGGAANVIKIQALQKGTYGNNIMVDIDEQGTGRIIRIKIGNIVELFDNAGDVNGFTSNQEMADVINARSRLVSMDVNSAELVDSIASYEQLEDGHDGADNIVTEDYTTAFDNIVANEEWDILMIPNTHQTLSLEDTDAFHTTMLAKINYRADTLKKYGMYVTGVSQDENIPTIQARNTVGERFVLCAPSIYYTSRIDDSKIILDGTYLGCALAGKICDLDDDGGSPTRKEVIVNDLIINSTTDKKYYDNVEIEQLLNSRVCVASRISNALRYARGVTRIADVTSIFFEINIMRIVDNIKTTIQNTLQDYLGEPNSDITRERMKGVTDGILEIAQNRGLLNEYMPTIVTEGPSVDTVNVAINIRPAYSTNFIDVVITIA